MTKQDEFIGKILGDLTVISKTDRKDKYNRSFYILQCSCGNIIERTKCEANNKRGPRSCGCKTGQSRIKDITGKHFGKLTAVRFTGDKCSNGDYLWECQCDCGGTVITSIGRLNSGKTNSCGCLHKESARKKDNYHGLQKTRAYKAWAKIKERCYNPNDASYKDYGAVGVTMWEGWKDNFVKFYEDLGESPTKNHSVDRIDANKGYYPDNCRWANQFVQARNRRKKRVTSSNYKGVSFDEQHGKYRAAFRIKYDGVIYGGPIYRYETEEEAAAAYNLATVMTFEGFDPSIYVLNDTDYPMEKIDTNINFFKKHIPKLKEIALLSYKD